MRYKNEDTSPPTDRVIVHHITEEMFETGMGFDKKEAPKVADEIVASVEDSVSAISWARVGNDAPRRILIAIYAVPKRRASKNTVRRAIRDSIHVYI